jgi:hypothetical protein
MREAIVILGVIVILLLLTAFRYRKQLMAGLEIWRMFKKMRQDVVGNSKHDPQVEPPSGRLMSCSKCGTWVLEEKAIRIGGMATYCSRKCFEGTAVPRSRI